MAGVANTNGESARGRILVVDDDKPLTDTYAAWLSDRYEVLVANSGEEALELVDGSVDVVLLDRRMRDLTGDEVLERIRDRGLDCRVSMLTAVQPDSDIVDMPFEDYLVKPVSRDELLRSVDRLLLYEEIDTELGDVLAMSATWDALAGHDESDFRDPEAVASLQERLEAARDDEGTRKKLAAFERVRRATSALREANRRLTGAETRSEVEAVVAETLVETGVYETVFVGGYPRTGGALEERVRRRAGDESESEPLALDVSGPLETALDTGTVETATLELGDPLLAPVDGDGPRCVAVLPLVYRETTYGAVLAYAPSEVAKIPDSEVSLLSELAERVASELNDAENRRLVFADARVVLTLETTDRRDPFIDLSAALGCEFELRGFVPVESGTNCYLAVGGADAEAVSEHLADADGVARYRAVSRGKTPVFEVTVGDDSLVHTALGASANVVSFEIDGGKGTFVVEVASGGNVRRTIETLQNRFPATEFRGKHTTEENVQSAGGFRSELDDVLTDRQRTVVETAYEAGYYEFPRSSDGEQVADTLSISAATFHQHLRRATEKLVGVSLNETDPLENEE